MAVKTRFRIFLQPPYVPGFEQPVTVEIDTEDLEPGPGDRLLYVLDAQNKPSYRARAPHALQRFRGRPWKGHVNRVVARKDYDGHFDHLAPDDPAFPAASVYATARLVLNFWNRIFEEAGLADVREWHHRPEDLEAEGEKTQFATRLQLIPRCVSAGSRTGYGYVELGRDNPGHRYREGEEGPARLVYQRGALWQNFDVIAHEMGHAILFQRIGFPAAATGVHEWFAIPDAEFLTFHESMADLVAILSLLDVKEAREFFLTRKDGIDIAAGIGELQRLAEPGFLPIRSAKILKEYPGRNGFKPTEAHDVSMSLTGAVFEILMKVYDTLVRAYKEPTLGEAENALAHARDIVATSLARLWADPDYLWDSPGDRRGFNLSKVAGHLPTLVSAELAARAPSLGSQATTTTSSQGAVREIFHARKLV